MPQQEVVAMSQSAPCTPTKVTFRGRAVVLAERLRQQSFRPFPASLLQTASEHGSNDENASHDDCFIGTRSLPKFSVENRCYNGQQTSSLKTEVNYLNVNCDLPNNGFIYQHRVTFIPDVDSSQRMKIMRQQPVVDAVGLASFCDAIQSSSSLLLFSPVKLDHRRIRAVHPADPTSTINVLVTFTRMAKFNPSMVNGVFSKLLESLKWTRMGDCYYNQSQRTNLCQHALEIWPGLGASCKKDQVGRLVVEMDLSSYRFRRIDTVWDMMGSIAARQKDGTAYKEECLRQLLNQIVTTHHNNRTHRIEDIDWKKTPESTVFRKKDGSVVSLLDYYLDHFGITIRDPKQPLLITKRKIGRWSYRRKLPIDKGCFLVPELCHFMGLSHAHKSDQTLMRQIAQFTQLTPRQRVDEVHRFCDSIAANEQCQRILNAWYLTLGDRLVRIDGQVMRPEKICTFDSVFDAKDYEDGDFSRCIDCSRPLIAVPFENWAIVYERGSQQQADELVKRLIEQGKEIALKISPPQRHPIGTCELKTRTIEFIHAIRKIKDQKHPPIGLVVVILPWRSDQHYIAVKQECNAAGLVSQCVTNGRLNDTRIVGTVCHRLFLQIEVKLGAELWGVPMPDCKLGGLMGVGLDVYHSPHRNQPSWVALVGSLNQTQTRYYNVAMKQLPREEAVHGLAIGFTKLLMAYRQVNAALPKKIMVFRDGLGSDQMKMSKEFEIKQIREAFKAIDPSYSPEFVFIVCVKRIGVRIFNGTTGDYPPPGTVVDRVIGEPNWFDFYLVSQSPQTTPCHYVVIEDTSCYSPLQIQRLVWKFTYLCYERPSTARQPAPAVYADRFAYMVGHILKAEPNVNLRDKLFYL